MLSVLISVISAYLVVSWLVGSKLNRGQVIWINLLSVTFSLMTAFRWVTGYRIAMQLQNDLLKVNPGLADVIIQRKTPEMIAGIACIYLAAILGSLKFMWDVRHPKKA